MGAFPALLVPSGAEGFVPSRVEGSGASDGALSEALKCESKGSRFADE